MRLLTVRTNNFSSWEQIQDFLSFFFILLITASFPFSKRLTSISIVLLLITWLLDKNIGKKLSRSFKNKYVLIYISLFVIYLIGLCWSANLQTGFRNIEKKMALFFLPLVLSQLPLSCKKIKYILITFISATFLAALYGSYFLFQAYQENNHYLMKPNNEYFRDLFVHFIGGIHPTYYGFYVVISIAFVFYLASKAQKRKLLFYFVALVLAGYFMGILVMVNTKMPLFSGLVVLLFLGVYFVVKQKNFFISIGIVAAVAIAILKLYNDPYVNFRYRELFTKPLVEPKEGIYNSIPARVGILTCSANLLKYNWLFGVGTGDSQDLLNACYKSRNYIPEMLTRKHNAHNQFLETALALGLVGLLTLVFSLLASYYIAIRNKDLLYFIFIGVFCLCCLTESMLESQKGIVAFAFFNAIFAFRKASQSLPKEQSPFI